MKALLLAALSVSACVADEIDLEVVSSDLTSSSLVLTGGTCTPYASLAPIAQNDTANANRYLGMTPSQRRSAGAITNPKLSSGEVSDYNAIQTNPCHVAGEWSCVSGTGEGGHHWAMCTDGITTCGVGTTGPGTAPIAWCR